MLVWLVQMSFLLIIHLGFRRLRLQTLSGDTFEPISVVVCARNEAHNLTEYLPFVLQQDYPDFEVVVVNDASDDDTDQVLERLGEVYPRLSTLYSAAGNKKQALKRGIAAASHQRLVLTDADCCPASNQWLKHLSSVYSEDVEIVLGYGAYIQRSGFLNTFIRFETVFTAMQYFTAALLGLPYMGVGRNLSYTKALFNKSQALDKSVAVLSGDDDLLVNEMAIARNTRVCINNAAFTYSKPEKTWRAWFHQKRRHSEAGHYYRWQHRLVLGTLYLSQVLLYPLFILTLFSQSFFIWSLILFSVRFVTQAIIYGKIFRLLKEDSLLKWLWICDFLISLFFSSLGLLTAFKINVWKENLPHQVEHKKTWNWFS